MKQQVFGLANDNHTYHLLNLLFKLKIVNVFVDARPIEFNFNGMIYELKNMAIISDTIRL